MDRKPILAIAVTLTASLILGSHPGEASPTCMRFIEISTVPRIAALGQAGVGLTDETWAEVNPAHLVNSQGSLIGFSHISWFSDVSLEAFTINTSSGRQGFGLNIVGLHTEPLDKYNAEDTYEGSFRFFDVAVAGTYARRFKAGLRAGITAKVLYEKIDWDAASGVAADIGVSYRAPEDLLLGSLGIGLLARNLGTRIGYHGEQFDLPSAFQVGVSYAPSWLPPYVRLNLALDYQKTRVGEDGLLAGLEVSIAHTLAVRFGYRGAYESEKTFGMGINLSRFSFDYAYMELGHDLGGTHRFAISLNTASLFPSPEESR